MGTCCSEFDGELYEEDFSSSDESSDEENPAKHLPGGTQTTCNRDQPPMLVTDVTKVTRTPPGPMLVVKDDALGLTGVSRKEEVFPPPELPRLGLRGPFKCETAEEVTEKTLAKDLKIRSHRQGLSFANGLSHLGDPKEEAAMEEHEESEAKESNTLAEVVEELFEKLRAWERMRALAEELEEESAEKPVAKEDPKTGSHRRGLSSASWAHLPALEEEAAEDPEESEQTEEKMAEKMLVEDLKTWSHQEGWSAWFETMGN